MRSLEATQMYKSGGIAPCFTQFLLSGYIAAIPYGFVLLGVHFQFCALCARLELKQKCEGVWPSNPKDYAVTEALECIHGSEARLEALG
jgi:hypothetical protein